MNNNQEIKKLQQEVINQIAAGEVIERPASVIKELVDNSIDSGATRVDITIKGGGKKLIEISDNGSGMSKDQLIEAFEPHTTSKLRDLSDLESLQTMGFRGEALSTIISVSTLEVTSRVEDEEVGTKITFEGIKPLEVKEYARERGTTVSVMNLFNNIPARLKYLRTDETEYRYILQTIIPFLIYHKEIHFTLKKDGREVYNLPRSVQKGKNELSESRIQNVVR